MKKKIALVIMLLGLGVISIQGQNKLNQNNTAVVQSEKAAISYTDFVKQLSPKINIAHVKMQQEYLLTTEQTFLDRGKKLTMEAEVYLVKDDKVIELISLSSSGTAYPIAWDEKGFYAAGGHGCSYYQLQGEKLVMTEYVTECFDENGKASYEVFKNGQKSEGSEKDFEIMFDRYLKATPVVFE